ncbi:hypothetical protein V8G54_026182 [Vigna mungo]|uniref:Uncharacterized protein n=1 Tax=Vigna mungo TaxID=3915 RepID=A0AAQ3MZ59_VIGMU
MFETPLENRPPAQRPPLGAAGDEKQPEPQPATNQKPATALLTPQAQPLTRERPCYHRQQLHRRRQTSPGLRLARNIVTLLQACLRKREQNVLTPTLNGIHPSLLESEGSKSVSNDTIQQLAVAIEELREVKLQRMQKLQDLASTMLELWNLMDTPVEEQQMFQSVTSNIAALEHEVTEPNTLSLEFINLVEAEVARLEKLKSSKMKELVLKKRTELEEICRKTHLIPEIDNAVEYAVEAIESVDSMTSFSREDRFTLHLIWRDPNNKGSIPIAAKGITTRAILCCRHWFHVPHQIATTDTQFLRYSPQSVEKLNVSDCKTNWTETEEAFRRPSRLPYWYRCDGNEGLGCGEIAVTENESHPDVVADDDYGGDASTFLAVMPTMTMAVMPAFRRPSRLPYWYRCYGNEGLGCGEIAVTENESHPDVVADDDYGGDANTFPATVLLEGGRAREERWKASGWVAINDEVRFNFKNEIINVAHS